MFSIINAILRYTWRGATVILSPQNLYPTGKLAPYAASLRKVKGRVLFDPQLYSPRKYHKNLEKHSYWSRDSATKISIGDCHALLSTLADINMQIGSDAYILPSSIIDRIDQRWGRVQGVIANQARQLASGKKTLITVALGKDVLSDNSQVETIIHYAAQWDVDGIYIVSEHPDKHYLIDKPIWVANLLSLVAGLKR